MNDKQQQLWDSARDGELSDEQQRRLDGMLADQPQLQQLWQRESEWLAMLGEADDRIPARDEPFTQRVLDRWEQSPQRPGVLARIGRQATIIGMGLAAMIVFAVAAWQFTGTQTPTPQPPPTVAGKPHPLGELVHGFGAGVDRATQQPARLAASIDRPPLEMIGFDALLSGVPDPDRYVQPLLNRDANRTNR